MSSAASQPTAEPDSRQLVLVTAGVTPRTALEVAGVELTGPSGVVVVRDPAGRLRDLDVPFDFEEQVEPVPLDSPDGLAVLRHSTAHVLAQAVQELFPNTLLGIGPPIQDGFYYDFLPSRPFTPEDLAAIEKKMAEIVKAGQRFSRREIDDSDARAELAHEKFKLELIGLKGGSDGNATPTELDAEEASQVGGGQLTMYDNLDRDGKLAWTDLCRGPHLPTTRRIPAFKLMRSAAAYWRGDQNNEQLQRIYGTAWATRDELKAYLNRLEEAAKRDHRKLGARAGPVQLPGRDRLRPGSVPPQGRDAAAGDGGPTSPSGTWRKASPTSTPRTSARTGCSTPPATCRTTPTACSRRWSWTMPSTG